LTWAITASFPQAVLEHKTLYGCANRAEAMEDVRPSEPSSSLDQVNDQDNNGNHEQKMDESAAKVADEAEEPEHD
jgi:hypothetical protein